MEVVKNIYRTHTCGELNINNVGEEIKLSGWVQKIRDLGGMIFIDLRDEVILFYFLWEIKKMLSLWIYIRKMNITK